MLRLRKNHAEGFHQHAHFCYCEAIAAAAVSASDAWSDAGEADGDADSDDEDARSSMMSCEYGDETATGSGQENAAPAIYSGHDVVRGDEAEDAAAAIASLAAVAPKKDSPWVFAHRHDTNTSPLLQNCAEQLYDAICQ